MIIYKYYDNKIKIITKLEKIISEININYIFFYKIVKFQNLKIHINPYTNNYIRYIICVNIKFV